MKAVIYGVKSSPDEKEAVKDQHRIIREAINDDDRIIGVYGEENASGFRKERGPQLEAAIRAAKQAAAKDGEAELWVWHSSRLARGDGTPGKRSITKLVSDLLYEGVTVRSALDDQMVKPMLAGIASEMANKYSADLSDWIKAGVARRRDSGKPVGNMPTIGYKVEAKLDENGNTIRSRRGLVITERVVDPEAAQIVVVIFERIADGEDPHKISLWLNAQGYRTYRGTPFTTKSVTRIILNEAYVGGKGYPRIVSDELAQAARAMIVRNDPAATEHSRGGRPRKRPYLLDKVAFCAGCGARLYYSHKAWTHPVYVCKNRNQATGVCMEPVIPAELLEAHVLNHLGEFVGSVEQWITDRLATRDLEYADRTRKLDREQDALKALLASRDRQLSEYRRLADEGHSAAYVALEVIEKIDGEVEAQEKVIAQVAAAVEEHSETPDVDRALDYYNELVEAIRGKIDRANGIEELNAALYGILAGLWCKVDEDQRQVLVQFALRHPREVSEYTATVMGWGECGEVGDPPEGRLWLPPFELDAPVAVEQFGLPEYRAVAGDDDSQNSSLSLVCAP